MGGNKALTCGSLWSTLFFTSLVSLLLHLINDFTNVMMPYWFFFVTIYELVPPLWFLLPFAMPFSPNLASPLLLGPDSSAWTPSMIFLEATWRLVWNLILSQQLNVSLISIWLAVFRTGNLSVVFSGLPFVLWVHSCCVWKIWLDVLTHTPKRIFKMHWRCWPESTNANIME